MLLFDIAKSAPRYGPWKNSTRDEVGVGYGRAGKEDLVSQNKIDARESATKSAFFCA
jgi:hypothetical protein